jgi:tellurite methyltransferase
MSSGDADRWNFRYQTESRAASDQPRDLLVSHANLLPSTGLALDIAMGLGGNAGFLLQHGLRVVGVDISRVAVCRAKKDHPSLMAVIADLKQFTIPADKFNVIINFLYLQRDLWLPALCGLKIGGLLFMECLTEDMLSVHPEIDPIYLLKPAELKHEFVDHNPGFDLEILHYYEGWSSTSNSHRRAVASLIARRNS